MIEVENVSKSFGPVTAVEDISFTVRQGEILGFLGPNGAGKTTTMRILTGFFPPSRGRASVGGCDVFEDSLGARKKIGYLPENVPLYKEMRVADYLKFAAEIKGVGRRRIKAAVAGVMEDTGLTPMARRPIAKLSKGFRQRVGLAQALLGEPEALILDEPTIGLDPRQIAEIRALIKSLAGSRTIILSTHILPEVSMTCDRVVIINQGRVVAEDTPENLSRRHAGGWRLRLRLGGGASAEDLTALEPVSGAAQQAEGLFTVVTEPAPDAAARLARAIVQAGWDLYELTPLSASLEDVFINLVTQENNDQTPAKEDHDA